MGSPFTIPLSVVVAADLVEMILDMFPFKCMVCRMIVGFGLILLIGQCIGEFTKKKSSQVLDWHKTPVISG
jgi:hypothetical protein